ncbi:transmembrane protein 44 [Platysternon megacephalum]|nr:transmembrane protein 44 [Platysternon megacephalum]
MARRRTQQVGAGTSTEQYYIYKVVLLGSTAVGKSSIAFRYVKNDFRESMPTVGSGSLGTYLRSTSEKKSGLSIYYSTDASGKVPFEFNGRED